MVNDILLFNHLSETKERINAKRVIQANSSEEQSSTKEQPKSFSVLSPGNGNSRHLPDRLIPIISILAAQRALREIMFYGIWNGDRLLESLC